MYEIIMIMGDNCSKVSKSVQGNFEPMLSYFPFLFHPE